MAWTNSPRNQGGIQGIRIPILSDLNKKLSRELGVLLEDAGITLRGLFIIDPEGVIQYEVVHALGIGRSVEETLRVLRALQHNKESGEVCPANWNKGKTAINPKKAQDYFSRAK